MDLRKDFFDILLDKAKKDKSIHLLVGDLGFSFLERFQKELPRQFTNVGIAEQNMVSMAAGMAIAGKKPYCYSGLIFLLMRAFEQVRDDIAYNNTDVKLIGTGASQFLGFTHNLTGTENEEDLLKNLPNLKRFYPKDKKELAKAMRAKGPCYIRL
jgi:transketolase